MEVRSRAALRCVAAFLRWAALFNPRRRHALVVRGENGKAGVFAGTDWGGRQLLRVAGGGAGEDLFGVSDRQADGGQGRR